MDYTTVPFYEKMAPMLERLKKYRVPLLYLLAGFIIGWLLPLTSPLSSGQITSLRGMSVRVSSINYQYISPLLACDVGSEDAFPEFAPLRDKLTDLINREIAKGDAQHISLYLRSLKGGRWLDINENETYAPASLLKIFVMMAYYKEANETDNPSLLEQQVPFESSAFANDGTDEVGGTIDHLVDGKLYTIDQLINQMIIYSDNDAYATLLNHFDPTTLKMLQGISQDLSVPLPVTHAETSLDFMPVDAYAMIFRVLFGSTYLSERYSSKALALLAQAKYTTGLVAGVPSNLQVAHKYGIRAVVDPTPENPNQLHDCGIVYYPNHPYLLCVMTKGLDLAKEQEAIQEISSAAYSWLDAFYKALPVTTTATTTPS